MLEQRSVSTGRAGAAATVVLEQRRVVLDSPGLPGLGQRPSWNHLDTRWTCVIPYEGVLHVVVLKWRVFVSLTAGYVVNHRSEPHVRFGMLVA